MQMPMLLLGLVFDRDLRGPKAFLFHFRSDNVDSGQAERSHAVADRAQVGAGIHRSRNA